MSHETRSKWENNALVAWRNLVAKEAAGEEVTHEELCQAAAMCGRSAAQFAAHVRTLELRYKADADRRQAEEMAESIHEERRIIRQLDEDHKAKLKEAQEAQFKRAELIRQRKLALESKEKKRSKLLNDALELLDRTADADVASEDQEARSQPERFGLSDAK
jgi:hypothetical protein